MLTIIILVVLGVLLLVAEIVVLPGVGIAGIAGVASIVTGIVIAYSDFGTATGHITIIATFVLSAIAMYYALRSRTWKRLTLKKNIDSTVDISADKQNIQKGDTGIAITRLAPMGKVRINGIELEARTTLDFVDHDKEIVVVDFEDSKVIVEEKK